jgi:hypothetical protein
MVVVEVAALSPMPPVVGVAAVPAGTGTSGAPHRAQYRLSAGFSCPQWVQNIHGLRDLLA